MNNTSETATVGALAVSSLVLLWLTYKGMMTDSYYTAYLVAWVAQGGINGWKTLSRSDMSKPATATEKDPA